MHQCKLNARVTVFAAYLSGFGRGLDKRHPIASCKLLRLPRLHRAGTQVALVPHQHHGDAVTVLHPVDLLSEEEAQGNTNKLAEGLS